MKTRKVNRRKRIRRNKTIRGGVHPILGDTPPLDTLPRLFKHASHNKKNAPNSISRSISPNRYEDLKHSDFLDKNDKYLNQILEFTNTTKGQFEKFASKKKTNKDDIENFFNDKLNAYLKTQQFNEDQTNILKSYFDTDDFDAIMAQYVGEEEEQKEWFSPRRHKK
jgi:hypothetical protein